MSIKVGTLYITADSKFPANPCILKLWRNHAAKILFNSTFLHLLLLFLKKSSILKHSRKSGFNSSKIVQISIVTNCHRQGPSLTNVGAKLWCSCSLCSATTHRSYLFLKAVFLLNFDIFHHTGMSTEYIAKYILTFTIWWCGFLANRILT